MFLTILALQQKTHEAAKSDANSTTASAAASAKRNGEVKGTIPNKFDHYHHHYSFSTFAEVAETNEASTPETKIKSEVKKSKQQPVEEVKTPKVQITTNSPENIT